MTTVLAAVCEETGTPLKVQPIELEEPRADEVLVRIVATGICHTDIGMRDAPDRVPKPIVLGHEGAGIVVKTGSSVAKVKPGDHVVVSFNSCGHCPSCNHGDPAYCVNLGAANFSGRREDGSSALTRAGNVLNGHFFGQSSFATHAICRERNVVPVRRDAPLELLGPLGCGFQTGAGAVLNSLKVEAGSAIAVFGTGSVGLAAVMAAKVANASRIIAVDVQASRLETARRMGATHTVDASSGDVAAQLKAIAPAGLGYAIDTTGNTAVIQSAVQALGPHGVCGLISSGKGASVSLNLLQMMLGGRVVRGIHQGDSVPDVFIPQLIDLYLQGRFPFDQLVSFYALEDVNQAMADMESGKAVKPILRMPAS
ncbi:aryl-alcohol dehydrogenase [Noviherbaspirillum humi]|uniref:Aryl-alcohol dehydrogenase n=1 Tax=Noviherbaspirillum humi TaxID=1688639 RepID=A0A239I291_9BURK|nr:NAD(P)-dependent alcohol dehydrogenase [Noviherbaspirillum humi]SNS87780.1 aryl-alcohol dehydrogenase [Noviherbaspirillum humi]